MTARYLQFKVDACSRGPQGYRFRRDKPQSYTEALHFNQEVTAWCTEQFGEPGKRQRWRYRDGWAEVHFRDECDAFAFRMRWS